MDVRALLGAAGLPWSGDPALGEHTVSGIRYDSRAVRPGDIFVAVPGTVTDGHDHLSAAIAAGAIAVVMERAEACSEDVPCLVVPSSRAALADLAAAWYGFPARSLKVTGITGTDGKTTSSFLLSHVLESLGWATGLVSTVALKIGPRWEENLSRQSTPESPEVQAALAAMVAEGVDEAVVEATSHGLVLERVRRCGFDAALITNVTSEHLDFHGTRQRYLEAKALLLASLQQREGKEGPQTAAINLDDPGSASLVPLSPVPVVGFGLGERAVIRAVDVVGEANGSSFVVRTPAGDYPAWTPLPGSFNVSNCLAVLALCYGRGLDMAGAVAALASFDGVPGRMRRVDQGQPFAVIVDYAHTAESLKKVLETVRPLARGQVMVVFGSAGDRDREKRPIMGAVAARYADFSIFTDEDPRTEPSLAIIDAIAAGAAAAGVREGDGYLRIADRRQAIREALDRAQPGDLLVLAGKGHEQCILAGGERLPWDEVAVVREWLRERGYAG